MISKIKKELVSFFKDESAQGATEYILLLVVVVAISMMFKDKIKDVVGQKIDQLSSDLGGFTTN